MPEITLDPKLQHYVIAGYEGFSCLGFDVAFSRATKVAAWLQITPPHEHLKGTIMGYKEYEAIMAAGAEHHARTGDRCMAELNPLLIGKEGCVVEVVDGRGARRKFFVGRSTGWLPCHLEIERWSHDGGPAVVNDFDKITVLRRAR